VFWRLFPLLGWAALSAQEQPLDLKALIAEALERNPEIQAAQKSAEASRQRPAQAGSLPDPMFSAGYASSGSPRPFAGIGREPIANAGFMVTQEFPAPGKRKLRGDIALREADAELQRYREVRLSVVSKVKQAYHQLHHGYEAIDIMQRNIDVMRTYLRSAEARYAIGKSAQQDLLKAQTQISLMAVRIEKMRQDIRMRETDINMLLARDPATPMGRPPEVPVREWNAKLEDLFASARQNSPLLAREQKMIQRSELGVNLARKDAVPDYALSGGYFNMGSMPDMYQFRVDIRLPWFSARQRAEVTEQANLLAQSRRSYEAADQALLARIRNDYLLAGSARKLMDIYSTTLIQQASLTVESSLASYETGSTDFMTLLMNANTMLDYQLNYHEEMLSFHLAVVRLEEATGSELL
jgi:outer membrane protein, heavy metal efflux system